MPEPVERVSAFLREAGAEAQIEEFFEGTPTAADAAEAVGCELAQIVKSLVLVCDGLPVVAFVPGDRRGDPEKIARAAGGDSARIATREEVLAATGFPAGAVAPFPLPKVETVLLDRSLLQHPKVWAGAGSSRHIVGLSPGELVRLSRARPMDVVQDSPYDFGPHTADSPSEPKER
jgi:prolyl-tRNA editing enzyme YbaK/EbsC (Cys-tRNA(Pro) deacylase)